MQAFTPNCYRRGNHEPPPDFNARFRHRDVVGQRSRLSDLSPFLRRCQWRWHGRSPGVTARLPYLKKLGVDAVWLSPFYKSPQADAGYDVADYRQVDPMFGSLDDFDEMLHEAHALGVKVIVDLVPNHTSDEHVWFQEALAAEPGSAARERYMFRPGKDETEGSGDGNTAPNNWKSIFGGPAWTRTTNADGTPGDWYLHLFDTKQPDLNWENPEVQEEMRSVLRFWLDRGVDGFRVDVAHGMVKEAGLPDWEGVAAMVEGSSEGRHLPDAPGAHPEAVEPHSPRASLAASSAGADDAVGAKVAVLDAPGEALDHQPVSPLYPPSPFFDQDGVHDIYRDWNRVLAGYDGDRMLVAEAWVEPAERLARLYPEGRNAAGLQFRFPPGRLGRPAHGRSHRGVARGSRFGRRTVNLGAEQP